MYDVGQTDEDRPGMKRGSMTVECRDLGPGGRGAGARDDR